MKPGVSKLYPGFKQRLDLFINWLNWQ